MTCSPVARQRTLVLATLCIAAWAPAPASSLADEPAGNAARLEGTWKLTSVEVDEQERSFGDDLYWVVNGTTVLYGGAPLATLVNYPDSTPKGIDLLFSDPKRELEGIYSIENDVLTICVNTQSSNPRERPSSFTTKDKSNWRILRFERVPADKQAERGRGFVGVALSQPDDSPGVVVQSVLEGSPAEKAGLRAGDAILRVGGETIRDLQEAVDAVRIAKPGSTLTISIRREGQEREITVAVALFPFSLVEIFG